MARIRWVEDDAALLNLFVGVADAFDIHPPPMLEPEGPPKALTR